MSPADREAFMRDAEAKQAAYAAKRRAWAAGFWKILPSQQQAKPQPRTADMQAVVDATNNR